MTCRETTKDERKHERREKARKKRERTKEERRRERREKARKKREREREMCVELNVSGWCVCSTEGCRSPRARDCRRTGSARYAGTFCGMRATMVPSVSTSTNSRRGRRRGRADAWRPTFRRSCVSRQLCPPLARRANATLQKTPVAPLPQMMSPPPRNRPTSRNRK